MASIRRHPKSGRWQVRYRDPTKKQRSKTFARKVDAVRFAREVEADMDRGRWVDPQRAQTTVAEYAERWMATRGDLAASTLDRDRSYLASLILPTFESVPVGAVRTSQVEAWLAGLTVAVATRRKALAILRNVLDMARRDGAIYINPADDVAPPRETAARPARRGRALSDEEVAAVLDAAETVDPGTAGIVWLLARCGLRIGEALALKRDHIDFAAGLLTVAGSMSRREGVRPVKGRIRASEGRTIPVPPDVIDRLRRHVAASEVTPLEGWLFVTRTGRPWRYTNWRNRRWRRIVETAGIGDVRPHDLRHTAATRLFVVDRWTPAEVQAYLGHRDPRTTLRIYTHVTSEGLPSPSPLGDVDTMWTPR